MQMTMSMSSMHHYSDASRKKERKGEKNTRSYK